MNMTNENLAQKIHTLGFFDIEERARKGEFATLKGRHRLLKLLDERAATASDKIHARLILKIKENL